MGSKYQPSIKDHKASLRFHENKKREAAKAAGKSRFLTYVPANKIPAAGEAPAAGVSAPQAKAPAKR
jgi:hypothetical protein